MVPQIGGLENHVRYLSSAQWRHGHDVVIVMPRVRGLTRHQGLETHEVTPFEVNPMASMQTPRRLLELAKIALFLILAMRLIVRLHKKTRFDVVHIHGGFPLAVFAVLLRISLGSTTVVTLHSSPRPSRWFRRLPRRLNPLAKVDAVIGTSEAIASEVLEMGVDPDRVCAISSGVDLESVREWEQKRRDSSREVIFVGRLRGVKGVHFLIEAMRIVVDAIPDAHLTVVGDGPDLPELKLLVKRLGLDAAVTFTGSLSHSGVFRELAKASVFVLPSTFTKREVGEGRPTALMEALCMGIPVVATRVGGIPELVRNGVNGFLVQPNQTRELAHCIVRVLSDYNLRKQLGQNGRVLGETVSWERTAERVEEVYRKHLTRSAQKTRKTCATSRMEEYFR
ncbi:MAG: glycosyltransferase family 4 protein [Candidatus Thorarchaeota archaeon]|nr:glycosyltransferase family 4 protein [Candidatus Thorarchaeota archaeon]